MVITAQNIHNKPGYKQTEIGMIPEDWEVKTLGDFGEKFVNGGTPSTQKSEYWQGNIPWITGADVINQKVSDIRRFITTEAVKYSSTNIVEKGNLLLVTRTGVGKLAIAPFDVAISQDITGIYVKKDQALIEFLFHYFDYSSETLKSLNQGTSIAGITRETLLTTKVCFPSLPEQKAIATTLSDVDALITSLDKLIAKKRDIKQATMQQLLTGKMRLPGFNGEWDVKKLREIGEPYGGLSGKSKENFVDGQYPYIPFLNIMNNPVIDINYFDYVNIGSGESQNKVIKGDLLFNGSSETPEEVGMCSVLDEDIPNLYLNSFCFGFRLNKELKPNGLYLSYYFRSSIGRQLFYSLAQGATRYNLSKRNFLKMEIPYPGLKEQQAIATILSDMGTEIAALEQRRDKTRALKQGMMQELLTGKTRLL